MNGSARSLLLAVYLTGTVLAPTLHLIFHEDDHDHIGGGTGRHLHPQPDSHEHPHGHVHPHPHDHPHTTPTHEHQGDHAPEPEHGSGSFAHFDAALSDGVAHSDPLGSAERIWMREHPEPAHRYELLDPRDVAVRGPPPVTS